MEPDETFSVYLVIVRADVASFDALAIETFEGPEEVARDVSIEEAQDLVRQISLGSA